MNFIEWGKFDKFIRNRNREYDSGRRVAGYTKFVYRIIISNDRVAGVFPVIDWTNTPFWICQVYNSPKTDLDQTDNKW